MTTTAAIAAPTFDPVGHVVLQLLASTSLGQASRRVSRVATLDGGSVLNDSGFADGDRTIELRWTPNTRAEVENVQRMLQTYATLHVVTEDGAFLAAPESLQSNDAERTLRLLVISRLSA